MKSGVTGAIGLGSGAFVLLPQFSQKVTSLFRGTPQEHRSTAGVPHFRQNFSLSGEGVPHVRQHCSTAGIPHFLQNLSLIGEGFPHARHSLVFSI
jgi:hypothetical protein